MHTTRLTGGYDLLYHLNLKQVGCALNAKGNACGDNGFVTCNNKVVLLCCRHSRHHRSERVVNVDLSGITVVLRIRNASHSREHSRHILRVLLNGQWIGGKGILLNGVYIGGGTLRYGVNKGDTDNAYTSRKSGEKRASFLVEKIGYAK